MEIFGGAISVKGVTFFLFAVFAIAALGYLLGRIKIKSVSLGAAGVFIVALIFGALLYAPVEAETAGFTLNAFKLLEMLGLVLFVTSVGFTAGPKFIGNIKKNFKSYVLIGLVITFSGGIAAVICILIGQSTGVASSGAELTAMVVGLLSGAMTSTPAFAASKSAIVGKATEAISAEYLEEAVTVGHGIAYLFGVIGIVLFIQLIPKIIRADMDKERAALTDVSGEESKRAYSGELIQLDRFNFMPFMAAAVIGIFIGSIKIPLTSAGFSGVCFGLTTAGGCLVTALVFGHFGRIGRVNVTPDKKVLKTFREFGLMLFLIGAGVPGGAKFTEYFSIEYFLYGVLMTVLPLAIGFIFVKYVLKLSLLNGLGSITGGRTSTPALGTLIEISGTEDVASAYAATYPVALISIVFISQLIIIFF
ncbi:MAG: permease [Clostridia bacterium]|nr:permease [Clostridia bacterium]